MDTTAEGPTPAQPEGAAPEKSKSAPKKEESPPPVRKADSSDQPEEAAPVKSVGSQAPQESQADVNPLLRFSTKDPTFRRTAYPKAVILCVGGGEELLELARSRGVGSSRSSVFVCLCQHLVQLGGRSRMCGEELAPWEAQSLRLP